MAAAVAPDAAAAVTWPRVPRVPDPAGPLRTRDPDKGLAPPEEEGPPRTGVENASTTGGGGGGSRALAGLLRPAPAPLTRDIRPANVEEVGAGGGDGRAMDGDRMRATLSLRDPDPGVREAGSEPGPEPESSEKKGSTTTEPGKLEPGEGGDSGLAAGSASSTGMGDRPRLEEGATLAVAVPTCEAVPVPTGAFDTSSTSGRFPLPLLLLLPAAPLAAPPAAAAAARDAAAAARDRCSNRVATTGMETGRATTPPAPPSASWEARRTGSIGFRAPWWACNGFVTSGDWPAEE